MSKIHANEEKPWILYTKENYAVVSTALGINSVSVGMLNNRGEVMFSHNMTIQDARDIYVAIGRVLEKFNTHTQHGCPDKLAWEKEQAEKKG